MRLDMTFEESNQRIDVQFAEVQTASDGGFERGYEQGYTEGNENGYKDGYFEGQEQSASLFGIQNEVTGTNIATCDYVNENEHNVDVKLSSDTVTDFSGIKVRQVKKNVFNKEWIKDKSTYDVQTGSYFRKYFYLEPNTKYRCVVKKPSHGNNTAYVVFLGNDTFDTDGANGISTIFGDSAFDKSFVFTTGASGKMIIKSNSTGFWQDYDTRVDDEQTEIMIYKDGMGYTDEYEPYTEKIYTANADGTVDGVTSISPTMNIICDTEGVNIHAKYYQCPSAEYDRFWDAYQGYGNRTVYVSAFYGRGWGDVLFKPKYLIRPVGDCKNIFMTSHISNIDESIVDLSNATILSDSFYHSKLRKVSIDLKSCTTFSYACYTCGELEEVKLYNLSKNCLVVYCLGGNNNLKKITISGEIGNSFNVQASRYLETESAKNIIRCLADYADTEKAFANTVTFHANVWNVLNAEGNTSPNNNSWVDYLYDIGWNKA